MRHQEISLAVGPIDSDRRALLRVLLVHYVSSELRITTRSLHNSHFCVASNKSLRKQVCDSSIGQATFNSFVFLESALFSSVATKITNYRD